MKLHDKLDQLIPKLAAWNNGAGIDPWGWINCLARYDQAMGYALIFWPDFDIYDDCIFTHEPDPQNYQSWMSRRKGDKTRVEAMLNHQHITGLFFNSEMKPTKDIVLHIGRTLKDMWSCRLKRDFPDRRIRVEFHEADSDELVDYQITVFQERE